MVISKINVKGMPVTCLNNSAGNRIKEITLKKKYRGKLLNSATYHFAEKSEVTGESAVTCENSVLEPIRTLQAEGNTTQQTYAGTNLLDSSVLVEKGINAAGEKFNSSSWRMSEKYQPCEANTSYVVAQSGRDNNYFQFTVWFYDENKKYLSGENLTIYAYSNTFTTPENCSFFLLGWSVSVSGVSINRGNIWVNKGTTVLSYEPYVGGIASPNPEYPQDIKNANSVNLKIYNDYNIIESIFTQGTSRQNNGIVCTYDADKKIFTFNGTATAQSILQWGNFLGEITVGKKYIIKLVEVGGSKTQVGSNLLAFSFGETRGNVPQSFYPQFSNAISSYEITPSYPYFTGFFFRLDEGTVCENYTIKLYFVESLQSVSIPSSLTLSDGSTLEMNFAKVGNYADKLVVDTANGKVTYTQQILRQVFKGTDNWQHKGNGSAGYYRIQKWYGASYFISGQAICNYYKQGDTWYIASAPSFTVTSDTLFFLDANYQTAEAFKSFVSSCEASGNPLTVQAVLATPVTTDITDTELGQQLLDLSSYDGTTIIEAVSETPTSSLTVSYWKQI